MNNYQAERLAQDEKFEEELAQLFYLRPQNGEQCTESKNTMKSYLLTRDHALLEAFKRDVGESLNLNLNEPQHDSFEGLIKACKGAHFIDVVVRKNGKDLRFQIDYLPKLLYLLKDYNLEK